MDVAYILGHQDQYEELRYSLRSLVHFPHRRVWVAGAPPPEWSQNLHHIPVEQIPLDRELRGDEWWYDRKLNMRTNLLRICEHPEVADRFLYMNDDFFLLEKYDESTPLATRGTILNFMAHQPMDHPQNPLGPYPSIYYHLQERGVADPWFVSEHIPLLVEKGRLAELMREAWHIPGFPYASLWGNLEDVPLVDWGKKDGDPLLSQGKGYREEWPDFWTTVSTTHIPFFDWPVGVKLRTLFSEPSPYERC